MKTAAGLISRPGDPVRTGFPFAGRYKEPGYADYWDIDPETDEEYPISSEWDFAKDRIKWSAPPPLCKMALPGIRRNGRPVRKRCSFVMRHGHGKCRIYGEIEKG